MVIVVVSIIPARFPFLVVMAVVVTVFFNAVALLVNFFLILATLRLEIMNGPIMLMFLVAKFFIQKE